MKLKPLENRVIVKPLEAEEQTAGGIILPDTAREKPIRGKVSAVGPGKLSTDGIRLPLEVNVGDVVIYGKYSGTDFKMNNEEYLILSDSDILAVVEN